MPKSRVSYWNRKFQQNVERDKKVANGLKELGWTVEIIWECEAGSQKDLTDRLRGVISAGDCQPIHFHPLFPRFRLYHEIQSDYKASQEWFDGLAADYPGNGLFLIYQAGNDFELGNYERLESNFSGLVRQPLEDMPIVESRAHHLLAKTHALTSLRWTP